MGGARGVIIEQVMAAHGTRTDCSETSVIPHCVLNKVQATMCQTPCWLQGYKSILRVGPGGHQLTFSALCFLTLTSDPAPI